MIPPSETRCWAAATSTRLNTCWACCRRTGRVVKALALHGPAIAASVDSWQDCLPSFAETMEPQVPPPGLWQRPALATDGAREPWSTAELREYPAPAGRRRWHAPLGQAAHQRVNPPAQWRVPVCSLSPDCTTPGIPEIVAKHYHHDDWLAGSSPVQNCIVGQVRPFEDAGM